MLYRGLVLSLAALLLLSPFAFAQTINASLTPSRTSGAAPLAVFFDATGTTCSGGGCSRAFHDLAYRWDFGDTDAGNWSVTGKAKNTAFGPTAAHVFEQAGIYSVTLRVEGAQGTVKTQTTTITVLAANQQWAGTNTLCFSGNGNFNGCPAGAQQVSSNSLAEVSNSCGNGANRCLLRRGEAFNGQLRLNGQGPGLVGAFGNGARPRLQNSSAQVTFGGDDWRVMDVEAMGDSSSNCSSFGTSRAVKNALIFRTTNAANTCGSVVSMSPKLFDSQGTDLPDGVTIAENVWRDAGRYGIFAGSKRLAIMGNVIDKVGVHVIRVVHAELGVIAHNELARQAPTKAILTNRSRPRDETCTAGCGRPTHSMTISDNVFRSSSAIAMNFTQAASTQVRGFGRDFLVERNRYSRADDAEGSVQIAVEIGRTSGVTVRNNLVVMDNWATYRSIEIQGEVDTSTIANNTCFVPNEVPAGVRVRCVRGNATNASNNLLFAPNVGTPIVVDGDAGTGSGNLLAQTNPFIAAVPQSSDDFVLREDSIAIGFATPLFNPIDFLSRARPNSIARDAGAFESGLDSGPPQPPSAETDLVVSKLVAFQPGDNTVLYDPFIGGDTQPLPLDTGFALCATVDGNDSIGSVRFMLDGAITGTEHITPYCQNDDDGVYRQYEEITAVGTYFLNSVTPYTGANATGVAGGALENIELVVVPAQSQRIPKPPLLRSVDP